MNLFRKLNNELPPETRVRDSQLLLTMSALHHGMELVLKKTDRHTEPDVTFMRNCINTHVHILDNRYTTRLVFVTLPPDVREEYCVELQQWVTLLNDEVREKFSKQERDRWGANHVAAIRTILESLLAQQMQVNEVI